MPAEDCVIVVEHLADNRYRARCLRFPDCEAIRTTENAARQAVAEAIERILREREETGISPSHAKDEGAEMA